MQLARLASNDGGAADDEGAAVLMARLVDNTGACVRREQVAAIGFAVFEASAVAPEGQVDVSGRGCVRLEVNDVLLDSPQVGEGWDLDPSGYNFRHEIHVCEFEAHPKRNAAYEFRYVFVLRGGGTSLVRFFVRAVKR